MDYQAATPKSRSLEDAPVTEPMGASSRGINRRRPDQDQKRIRREFNRTRRTATLIVACRTCAYRGAAGNGDLGPACACCSSYAINTIATVMDTQAWQLNPGDSIRMPDGGTAKVTGRPRPHETSPNNHLYVDTDRGTTLVRRNDPFQVVPYNSLQQVMPGLGTPDANGNRLPMGTPGMSPSSAPPSECPHCGNHRMQRQGDRYACSRCGNTVSASTSGANGYQFTDHRTVVRNFASVTKSAVAARAAALLNNQGEPRE